MLVGFFACFLIWENTPTPPPPRRRNLKENKERETFGKFQYKNKLMQKGQKQRQKGQARSTVNTGVLREREKYHF
jgi:hypothetical protein